MYMKCKPECKPMQEDVMESIDELLPMYDQVIFNNSCLELCLAQLKYPPIQRFQDDTYASHEDCC